MVEFTREIRRGDKKTRRWLRPRANIGNDPSAITANTVERSASGQTNLECLQSVFYSLTSSPWVRGRRPYVFDPLIVLSGLPSPPSLSRSWSLDDDEPWATRPTQKTSFVSRWETPISNTPPTILTSNSACGFFSTEPANPLSFGRPAHVGRLRLISANNSFYVFHVGVRNLFY